MNAGFRFGEWQVEVAANALSMGEVRATLEPRAMDVLRYLCRHPGAVIPAEELLQACWGTAELGDNPVHKAIAQLRRALGDSSTEPRYIETVRKRGYRAIAEVVEDEATSGLWQGGSPFRGLEAFEESHAAIFFGRTSATTRLRESVLRQVAGGCAMTLVLGPSGSGKTSLVRAGLLPSLISDGNTDAPVALDCLLHMDCADLGGTDLFGALAAVLLDAELDSLLPFDGLDAQTLGRRLHDDADAVFGTLGLGPTIRIAVFIDRLEAIFRAPGTLDADRARFVVALETLARCGVLVVLACRNDFYPDLIALPELVALKARGGHFDVDPPNGADIAQMVREPARAAGLAFERDPATGACLDDVLCDAARASPDALPLLQYCLDELYRQRGADGELQFDVFRQLGGIEGALGVRAEQVVAALPAAQQEALPHVLSLLVHVGEEQHAVTARRAPWSALTGTAQRELVRALVEARLFVSELAGNVPSFGVAHEALLRRWPRVVEWIERHRQALQLCSRVGAQASRWDAAGRPKDLLLPPGLQSNQARGLLEAKELTLPEPCGVFIRASLARAQRGERIRMGVMAVIALLAVLAGVLGLTARSAQREAEQRRADAEGLMSFMLGDFVDKLRPLGRLDLLDTISGKALHYLSSQDLKRDSTAGLLQRAKTLQLIAEVNTGRGSQAVALDALHSAAGILDRLLELVPSDPDTLKTAGANAFWLGQIAYNRGEWDAALDRMERYRQLSDRLVSAVPDDPSGWLELSYAYNSIGSASLRKGDLPRAADAFSRSVALKQRVLEKKPHESGLKVDLSNAYSWQASTAEKMGGLREAMRLYRQEERLLQAAHGQEPDSAVWTQRLASSFWRQADLMQALGESGTAGAYREAERHLQSILGKDPSNLKWRQSLYAVQLRLAALDDGATGTGRAELVRLNDTLRQLSGQHADVRDLRHLYAKSHEYLVRSQLRHGDLAQARDTLTRGLALYRDLREKKRDDALDAGYAQLLLLLAVLDRADRRTEWQRPCSDVRTLLHSNPLQSYYPLLAPLALAAVCVGDQTAADDAMRRLERIGYRDRQFLEYRAQFNQKKGMQ